MKPDQTLRKLGDAIRRRRADSGFSQEAFADSVGMHRTYYSAIERGEKNITVKSLSRIVEGLNVTMADILSEAKL